MTSKGPRPELEPLQALYEAPELTTSGPAPTTPTTPAPTTPPAPVALAPAPTTPTAHAPGPEAGPVASRGAPMPAGLVTLHGGPLSLPLRPDRPTIDVNFVTTLDGVVAMDREGATGGGEISGFSRADRFQMGLLRALADVILVAAGTVRAAPTHEWTPRRVARPQAALLEAWRAALGLAPQPTTVIVTARGDLDPAHPGLTAADVPVVVATTAAGATHLADLGLAAHVRVEVMGEGTAVELGALLDLLGRLKARVVVCEGGPHLLAELLAADLVDEVFLSLAPQLAGRAEERARLGLVEGVAFEPEEAPWGRLMSVHRAGQLLLLRYRLT